MWYVWSENNPDFNFAIPVLTVRLTGIHNVVESGSTRCYRPNGRYDVECAKRSFSIELG
jgi:hypothetical protein